ncbi:hypothetical protein NO1_1222 [Candidatus Termititenax aidoneus]|uniref:Uncharacterized protein n=1 Tax=Termititenax aidoneus TaxID=2218524 RepID=A0A388TBY9_TERA1|nr:hypothetical protein NO1_1222 [Candidatus Termititenax aidoneus]
MSAPVDKIYSNGISLTKWQNANQDGTRTWNTYQIQKSYKDANNQWQNTASYNAGDLAVIAALCQKMFTDDAKKVASPNANTTQSGYGQPAAAANPPSHAAATPVPPAPADDNCPF